MIPQRDGEVEALVEVSVLVWARQSQGLTIEEAAKKVPVPPERLEGWERGEGRPTIQQLRKLAEAYKLSLAAFYLPGPPKHDSEAERGGQAVVCELCGGPVTVHPEHYEVQERMHWLCFHIIYEHIGADADEPCAAPSCPQWHREVFRREIERLGRDPDQVLAEAIEERY